VTPREMSALIATVIGIVGTAWYIYLALTGSKIKPVLASWVVLSGTMTLSFATYWTTPGHSLIGNTANAVGVLNAISILITASYLTVKQGEGVRFSKFQKTCLWASLAIAILWIVNVWILKGTGILPNILMQILMVVGYLVTAEKLWSSRGNSESFFLWWSVTIASAISLYTAYVSNDNLAILYATRATIASATIVWLMRRAERRALLVA